jgi:hypothetical protein
MQAETLRERIRPVKCLAVFARAAKKSRTEVRPDKIIRSR